MDWALEKDEEIGVKVSLMFSDITAGQVRAFGHIHG